MGESMLGLEAPDPSKEHVIAQRLALEAKHKNGAGWFTWIAILSLVNSIIILSGAGWSFLIGLGMTQIVDGIALAGAGQSPGAATAWKAAAFVVDLGISGLFLLFGYFAKRRAVWAFVVGMAIYAIDGAILLYFEAFPAAIFHAFALVGLYRGLQASKELSTMPRTAEEAASPA